MSILRARYFDGHRSIGHDVSVVLGSGALKLVGREVDVGEGQLAPRPSEGVEDHYRLRTLGHP